MEAAGAGASLIALVETALSVAKTSRDLCKAIHDAPNALRQFSNKLTLVQSLLNELLSLYPRLDESDQLISPDLRTTLAFALEQSHAACQDLRNACGYRNSDGEIGIRGRLKWALLEKASTREALERLHGAESTLTLVLQVLKLRSSLITQSSLDTVLVAQNHLARQNARLLKIHEPIRSGIEEMGSGVLEHCEIAPNDTHCESAVQYRLPDATEAPRSATERSLGSTVMIGRVGWLRCLALSGTLSSYWDENQSTYSLSLRSHLPSFFGHRALVFELKIRNYVMTRLGFSLLYGSIAVSNVVSADSEIAVACLLGKEAVVRDLFQCRRGNPNDRFYRRGLRELPGNRASGRWYEETVLTASIKSGNRSLVKYLLDVGADVNALPETTQTSPVQEAMFCHDLTMARLLVSKGASLEHLDIYGRGAAHYLFHLFRSGKNWHGMPIDMETIRQCLDFLISNGYYDLGSTDDLGKSTLDMAVVKCTAEIASRLLQHGASRSLRTHSHGETLLHTAAWYDNLEIMPLLLQHGGDVNARDSSDKTPLHNAISRSHHDVFVWLLEHGADVNARDSKGNTALHYCPTGSRKITMLLQRAADINAKNGNGYTAILGTWYFPDRLESIRSLYRYGADPHLASVYHPHHWYHRPRQKAMLTFIGYVAMRCSWSVYKSEGDTSPDLWSGYLRWLSQKRSYPHEQIAILREFYPEVYVDRDGDIFWDTQETNVPGYGCSWDLWQDTEDEQDFNPLGCDRSWWLNLHSNSPPPGLIEQLTPSLAPSCPSRNALPLSFDRIPRILKAGTQ